MTALSYGVHDLTVELGGRTVLRDVSVSSGPGEVVAVVGGDGAGKSTLLRTIVGEVVPVRGSVRAPDAARTGYLTASVGSWAALTVRQNIDFAAGVYGVTGSRLQARRDELLERASLVEAADRPASQLSGGMRRKLGFCMAVVHEPELLVLDEPTTGVDPVSRVDLWRLVAQTAARGTAVIMTTTYLDEAERAASLTVLDDGSVLAQGPVDSVLAGLEGSVTSADAPVRPTWAWRRGRAVHELWSPDEVPAGDVIRPDLEDVVVALSLRHRAERAS